MMQSSDSFGSASRVLPYLRAYTSTRSYNSISGGEQEDGQQRNGGPAGGGGGRVTLAWRAVGAVAVFLAFGAAVSTSNTRWTASTNIVTGSAAATAAAVAGHSSEPREGHSYRGEFEAFEVSFDVHLVDFAKHTFDRGKLPVGSNDLFCICHYRNLLRCMHCKCVMVSYPLVTVFTNNPTSGIGSI